MSLVELMHYQELKKIPRPVKIIGGIAAAIIGGICLWKFVLKGRLRLPSDKTDYGTLVEFMETRASIMKTEGEIFDIDEWLKAQTLDPQNFLIGEIEIWEGIISNQFSLIEDLETNMRSNTEDIVDLANLADQCWSGIGSTIFKIADFRNTIIDHHDKCLTYKESYDTAQAEWISAKKAYNEMVKQLEFFEDQLRTLQPNYQPNWNIWVINWDLPAHKRYEYSCRDFIAVILGRSVIREGGAIYNDWDISMMWTWTG